MELKDKSIVITGAARGIGRALAERFAKERPRGILAVDVNGDSVRQTAAMVDGLSMEADLSTEAGVQAVVDRARQEFGEIDLFCSNAGIFTPGGVELEDEDWEPIFKINFRAHLWAARALLPRMLERGEGYLLQTVSAAGVLSQIGSAPYAVTKHAALALAEWISMTYGDRGIKVSCICPQGVKTAMLLGEDGEKESFLLEGALEPAELAEVTVEGIRDERFLILPHPEVAEFVRRKGADRDRWLRGMRRLQAKVEGTD